MMFFKKIITADLYKNNNFIDKCDVVIEDDRAISILQNYTNGHFVKNSCFDDYNKIYNVKYHYSWMICGKQEILAKFGKILMNKFFKDFIESYCFDSIYTIKINNNHMNKFKKIKI